MRQICQPLKRTYQCPLIQSHKLFIAALENSENNLLKASLRIQTSRNTQYEACKYFRNA